MNYKIIIGICILVLLVGCNHQERCEKVAKEDYGMSNPICNTLLQSHVSARCECANQIITKNSIQIEDFSYEEFKLKKE